MIDLPTLLNRIDAHVANTGAARSTISRKLFGNGTRLDQITRGGSLTIRKFLEAEVTLSDLERAA
jgi:hypothetical protein